VPQSEKVSQILEVLAAVRASRPPTREALGGLRSRATQAAADRRGINQRSVADKCWRGLHRQKDEDFHIGDFDDLVWGWLEGRPEGLMSRMLDAASTEDDRDAIGAFFGGTDAPPPPAPAAPVGGAELVAHVHRALEAQGLDFSRAQIADLYLSVRTKPFVLLAGVSGTGKSILARRFAEACGFPARLVPVRPDWSDPSELLGYRDLSGAFVPGRLIEHLVAATEQPERPYFVILDEMNLARVEHYFADLLSLMETRRVEEGRVVTDPLDLGVGPETELRCDPELARRLRGCLLRGGLGLPPNLCVIGTVNMDESTHPFSKKVLDRAMTLELVDVNLRFLPVPRPPPPPVAVPSAALDAPWTSLGQVVEAHRALVVQVSELLTALNGPLSEASMQVGFRTRDEICLYLARNADEGLLPEAEALDLAVHHKVLPRLQGGEELRAVLDGVGQLLEGRGLRRCGEKIEQMRQRLERAGFTAFWA
jgi:5-methylcytosine-specific restriction protein B